VLGDTEEMTVRKAGPIGIVEGINDGLSKETFAGAMDDRSEGVYDGASGGAKDVVTEDDTGASLGIANGEPEGTSDGESEGATVSNGFSDIQLEGTTEGASLGIADGEPDGTIGRAPKGATVSDGFSDIQLEGTTGGSSLGIADGEPDGTIDGESEGATVSNGFSDIQLEGMTEGASLEIVDGEPEGLLEEVVGGASLGITEGESDGLVEGMTEGMSLGINDGESDGLLEGTDDGVLDAKLLVGPGIGAASANNSGPKASPRQTTCKIFVNRIFMVSRALFSMSVFCVREAVSRAPFFFASDLCEGADRDLQNNSIGDCQKKSPSCEYSWRWRLVCERQRIVVCGPARYMCIYALTATLRVELARYLRTIDSKTGRLTILLLPP